MEIFSVNEIAFTLLKYPVSYIELAGTLFGLISVYFASTVNILTWPTGILNALFLILVFFQVQLYADVFLQFFFIVTTLCGWINWKNENIEISVTKLNLNSRSKLVCLILGSTYILGTIVANLHNLFPNIFTKVASFPYLDSFIMSLSIIATFLLIKKKIETWYLWILVDIICTLLYYNKQIYFLSLEYLLFLGLAIYGLINWKNKYDLQCKGYK